METIVRLSSAEDDPKNVNQKIFVFIFFPKQITHIVSKQVICKKGRTSSAFMIGLCYVLYSSLCKIYAFSTYSCCCCCCGLDVTKREVFAEVTPCVIDELYDKTTKVNKHLMFTRIWREIEKEIISKTCYEHFTTWILVIRKDM